MKFNTLKFGEIEVADEEVVTFVEGLPGFEEEKRFILLPYAEESPFFFLQSLQTKELAFLLISPFHFYPDYSFELDDSVVESLAIREENDIIVYSIVTIHGGEAKNMTANLLAPVVINATNKKARQIVLEGTKFVTRYNIFSQDAEKEKGGK